MNENFAPIINLGEINKCPTQKKQFEYNIDCQHIALNLLGVELVSPVKFEATVSNVDGLFVFKGQLTTKVKLDCGRCLAEFVKDVKYDIDERYLVGENQDFKAEDIIVLDKEQVELLGYIAESIEFALDSIIICKDDCLGLCADCGCDLNKSSCNCEKDNIDPRMAALKKLLEK